MRHSATDSLGVFLDRGGNILPVNQQVIMAVEAFCVQQAVDMSLFETVEVSETAAQPEAFIDPPQSSKPLTATHGGIKAYARDILAQGFSPGESHKYYRNGKRSEGYRNAVGMALVVFDGDRDKAESWLIQQAESTSGSDEDVLDRIRIIKWLIRRNNTVEDLARRRNCSTSDSEITITEDTAIRSERLCEALIEARRTSSHRVKLFPQKVLETLRSIIELLIATDNKISQRMLAEKCKVQLIEVQRLLEWITEGKSKCLLPTAYCNVET
jgi:hypothetical protein